MNFRHAITRNPDGVIVSLRGKVDASNIEELRSLTELRDALLEDEACLDATQLEKSDSRFIAWLLTIIRERRGLARSRKLIILGKKPFCRALCVAQLGDYIDIRCPESS